MCIRDEQPDPPPPSSDLLPREVVGPAFPSRSSLLDCSSFRLSIPHSLLQSPDPLRPSALPASSLAPSAAIALSPSPPPVGAMLTPSIAGKADAWQSTPHSMICPLRVKASARSPSLAVPATSRRSDRHSTSMSTSSSSVHLFSSLTLVRAPYSNTVEVLRN